MKKSIPYSSSVPLIGAKQTLNTIEKPTSNSLNSLILAGTFLLLFGVAIFSYIIGTLMEIIDKFNSFNTEPGDAEAL